MTDSNLRDLTRRLFGHKAENEKESDKEGQTEDPFRQFVANLFNQADND